MKEDLGKAYRCLPLQCACRIYVSGFGVGSAYKEQQLKIRGIFVCFSYSQSLAIALERTTLVKFLLWVSSKIASLHWPQTRPQTTAPRPNGCPLWLLLRGSLPCCKGRKKTTEAVMRVHLKLGSKFLFQELFALWVVYYCMFSSCGNALIGPNQPCGSCYHSVPKTGVCFWCVAIFSWCK